MHPSFISGADVVSAVDEPFGAIDEYRRRSGFRELLSFLKRLPEVGPYNGLGAFLTYTHKLADGARMVYGKALAHSQ